MSQVTMYYKWGCGYCMLARRLLRSKGVDWEEVPVTFRLRNFQQMVRRSHGRTTAPQIFIGERHVGGYRELADLEACGRLDEILLEAGVETSA